MRLSQACCSFAIALVFAVGQADADDWLRFRGSAGDGIAAAANIPTTWSDTENLQWKIPLPGPGSSSPIVVGDRLYVTCYTGYGTSGREGSQERNLRRQLLCIDRGNGDIVWERAIEPTHDADPYEGYITEHGYASSTPVSDGENIYVFFGKAGVVAFDLDGKQVWRVDVGDDSSNRQWGSAASPILHGDLLIVNASEESRTIYALNKQSGEEVWRTEGDLLELTYGTPLVVSLADGREELVIAVPEEVWGISLENGRLNWHVVTQLTGNISPSVVANGDVVYVFGGYRGSGSMAIRAGGRGDVSDTHVLWTSRTSSYVPSPIYHEDHLYLIDDRGLALCLDAADGEIVFRERLPGVAGGGGASRPFYASPVLVGDRLYSVGRTCGAFVTTVGDDFELIAHNQFSDDESDFNASPVVSGDQLFLRSNQFLYCVSAASN